ncbi:MAG: hypothetical protein A2804_03480 [Candidatus Pacebacteria bacterium RIFCSPHIGHO2_01_FULL_46_10]|nr:MAG: hypothetical protein A2804_03480 [Candidatus Pacebacteria bacterium RIFCSPHIGHO2_01_FULL_46_10]
MAMTQLKPPGNTTSQSNGGASSNNFAKALLETGGHVVQSTVDSGVQMAADALGSLFGAGGSRLPNASPDNKNENTQNNQRNGEQSFNQESQEQEWKKREMRMLRHREVQQVEVFNKQDVETKQKIEQLLEQLKALTKDLSQADRSAREAQIAVMQGAVNPGEYHATFFEKLIKVVMLLRKKVQESTSWIEQFNSRKSAQKGYWGQFYTNGTQWSMSQERSLATSVG